MDDTDMVLGICRLLLSSYFSIRTAYRTFSYIDLIDAPIIGLNSSSNEMNVTK